MEPKPTPDQLQPFSENPRYWQYRGRPVLLLGGSIEDNLFQIEGLEEQLDLIASVDGNVIRNTMSDRDEGDARAFLRLADGRYDLEQWGEEYWNRFETLLRETAAREIMVQIEVWDRFDHSRDPWKSDPYNPSNNVNYTHEESGLAEEYPKHPARNEQPFFYTVPELENNEVVLPYQQAFVRKLLSRSLRHDHVLYCMDNETSGAEEWGAYWARFIKDEAAKQGKRVYVTEMWDTWDVTADIHRRTTDRPELYDFIDLSQNTWITGQANWDHAQVVWQRISEQPRPINSTKIYGNDAHGSAQDRGTDSRHAIECFWRNLVGGFASSRFHRPDHGINISPLAQQQIRSARALFSEYDIFRSRPDSDLSGLEGREANEAFLARIEGEAAVVYFPREGSVGLRLDEVGAASATAVKARWLSLERGEWAGEGEVEVEKGLARLEAPAQGEGWVALVSW